MARLGSTETLDETYELAVHLERVDTFKGSSRGVRNPIGTSTTTMGLSRGDETSRTVVKFSRPISSFGEHVLGILWVPFSDHRDLIENGEEGFHNIPPLTA